MSASPLAQDGGEQGLQEEASKKIQFQFCRECSNLLYPKEDRDSHTLLFECRTCRWNREAESTCVYRNELANTVGETAGITQDVASDPTLPMVNRACPRAECDGEYAVYFQSQQRTAETGMTLFYVCTTCGKTSTSADHLK